MRCCEDSANLVCSIGNCKILPPSLKNSNCHSNLKISSISSNNISKHKIMRNELQQRLAQFITYITNHDICKDAFLAIKYTIYLQKFVLTLSCNAMVYLYNVHAHTLYSTYLCICNCFLEERRHYKEFFFNFFGCTCILIFLF